MEGSSAARTGAAEVKRGAPVWVFELGLLLTAIIWGGSFVVLKDTLDAMTPIWIIALRFGLATVAMVLVFHRRLARYLDLSHVVAGVAIGLPEGLGFLIQNVGLAGTTPGRNAFLTATYCVMVPFMNWAVTRRRPGASSVVAAATCLAGVGFLALSGEKGFGLGVGDLLTLLSAFFFALNIVAVGRFGSAHDTMVITTVMFAVSFVVCLGAALALEPVPDFAALPGSFWWSMAYVVGCSTMLGLILQNVGQRHVPPAQAALLMSLESVFAVLFSIVFYGERLTPALLAGFVLIFLAVTVSQFGPAMWERLRIGRK